MRAGGEDQVLRMEHVSNSIHWVLRVGDGKTKGEVKAVSERRDEGGRGVTHQGNPDISL